MKLVVFPDLSTVDRYYIDNHFHFNYSRLKPLEAFKHRRLQAFNDRVIFVEQNGCQYCGPQRLEICLLLVPLIQLFH